MKQLVQKPQKAGHYHIDWDGTDSAGRRVGSGVFLCRLRVGAAVFTHSLIRIN